MTLKSMLPWWLRERMNARKTRRYLGKAIEAVSPLDVATQNLRAEVHMMVGKNHLHRALAALHTFFHHSGVANRVGIMLHSDGTIGPRQKEWILSRVHGAELAEFPSKDERVRAIFQRRPYCEDFYRRRVSCMTRLVHMPVLARADRVIQLDSDFEFHAPPGEIIEWVDSASEPPPPYLVDRRGDPDPGPEVRGIFEEIRVSLGLSPAAFAIRDYFFSGGLFAFDARRFSFDIVESYLEWQTRAAVTKRREIFWFRDWTAEQTATMLNFATWPEAKALDGKYGMGLVPGAVCTHLLSSNYYKDSTLRRIRQLLEDIAAARAQRSGRNGVSS